MTVDGENIKALMRELKGLYASTASLLLAADAQMKTAGWETRTNQCVSVATIPASSAYWFPAYAFRVYKKNACPHVLPFISIVYDDREGGNTVPEPLLTAGWLDYGTGTEVTAAMATEETAYDYVDWHRTLGNERADDGRLVIIDWRKRQEFEKYKIEHSTTLGVPLVGVRSADDLRKQVIDPLLAGLGQAGY